MKRAFLNGVALYGVALFGGALLASCTSPGDDNPPCAGFDAANSDRQAIAIADQTMHAMGGRAAWDRVRILEWTFFGRRKHVWDKWTGDVRIEEGERVTLMNVNTRTGRVFEEGVELTDDEVRAEALDRGWKLWVNDSYWLVMPYKLKDSGVTLKYGGERALPDGRAADVLVLTFRDVGATPQNKYEVYVARDTKLVEQWSYFETAADAEPKITTPWAHWSEYAGIRLSGDRGERQLSDIAAFRSPVPAAAKLSTP